MQQPTHMQIATKPFSLHRKRKLWTWCLCMTFLLACLCTSMAHTQIPTYPHTHTQISKSGHLLSFSLSSPPNLKKESWLVSPPKEKKLLSIIAANAFFSAKCLKQDILQLSTDGKMMIPNDEAPPKKHVSRYCVSQKEKNFCSGCAALMRNISNNLISIATTLQSAHVIMYCSSNTARLIHYCAN